MNIVKQIEDNFFAAGAEWSKLTPLPIKSETISLMNSGIMVDDLNWVWNKKSLSPEDIEDIIKIKKHFRSAPRPFWWWVYPCGKSEATSAILHEQGFNFFKSVPCLSVQLTNFSYEASMGNQFDAFTLQTVRDKNDLLLWEQLSFISFAMPEMSKEQYSRFIHSWNLEEESPWQLFIAYADGKPAGSALIFLQKKTAGIYFLSVLPEYQRRGIGFALTVEILKYARKAGLELCVLQAEEAGINVYKKAGFRQSCSADIYTL